MRRKVRELDVVEVTTDQPYGLLEGTRGTVVALHAGTCSVEVLDADGYTIGLFEVPLSDVEIVVPLGIVGSIAREA